MERDTAKKLEVLATRPLASASTSELLAQLIQESSELAKKEVELARCELRADVRREIAMAKGLGVGGVCALCTLNMLLVAAALGLGEVVPPWASALIVAGVVLSVGAVAALIGWSKRVRKPLEKTQKTLKENVQWAKERLA